MVEADEDVEEENVEDENVEDENVEEAVEEQEEAVEDATEEDYLLWKMKISLMTSTSFKTILLIWLNKMTTWLRQRKKMTKSLTMVIDN